jgi:excisionase family DNA binding protein
MEERLTLSISECADALGCSERYLYELAKTGRLPGALRLGSRWLVRRDTLERWLDSRAQAELAVAVGP